MTKKEVIAVIASVILLALLVVLFILERKYPEGGAEQLATVLHMITGR